MPAAAVPAASVPFTACTVIVSTWFAFTAFVSVGGLISIHASTHFFNASLHGAAPAAVHNAVFNAVSVSRRIGCASTETVQAACTFEVPVTAEGSVRCPAPDAAPRAYLQLGEPTNEPGPAANDAVAVPAASV